ncbi:hypothetical protein KC851_01145 [Candidatus Kaiserbacteria bacterium]|nr:hypothetical protein [Candidatus Kaiserbacteria bacterium]
MKSKLKSLVIFIVVLIIFAGTIMAADSLANSPTLTKIAADFGYLGVLIIGLVTGLNTLLPLPAATFTPIFLAAGLSIPIVVIFLAVGTLMADTLGFVFGHYSREVIRRKHPQIFSYFYHLQQKHNKLMLPLVASYAAFIPFPNEAILIPLGLSGMKFKYLILPLVIGNIIHHSLLIYGATNIIRLF